MSVFFEQVLRKVQFGKNLLQRKSAILSCSLVVCQYYARKHSQYLNKDNVDVSEIALDDFHDFVKTRFSFQV